MFTKFGVIIALTLIIKSDCVPLTRDSPLQDQIDVTDEWNRNSLRVIRQTFGYPSSVQPRDQTVIVVPNSGSSIPYRGVPSTYSVNRAPTVVVSVPDDNYYPTAVGRSYVGSANRI